MSLHVFCVFITRPQIVSNNLGEAAGNLGQLKRVNRNGRTHIILSGESQRFALRTQLGQHEQSVGLTNRYWDETGAKPGNSWRDPEHKGKDGLLAVDDDLLGYMDAVKKDRRDVGKDEKKKDEKKTPGKKDTRPAKDGETEDVTKVRRSRMGHTPAMSLLPYTGDRTFNAASPGATASASRGNNPAPYGTEMIYSPFQGMFVITPEALAPGDQRPDRIRAAINSHMSLPPIGGKQQTFRNDGAPDSVIFRITQEPCPRIGLCFSLMEGPTDTHVPYSCPELLRLVKSGDVLASELIIGGRLAADPIVAELKQLGVKVCLGVKQAGEEAINRTLVAMDANKKKPPGKGGK